MQRSALSDEGRAGVWDLRSVFATADWVLIWRLHSTTGVNRSSGWNNNMGDDLGFV